MYMLHILHTHTYLYIYIYIYIYNMCHNTCQNNVWFPCIDLFMDERSKFKAQL